MPRTVAGFKRALQDPKTKFVVVIEGGVLQQICFPKGEGMNYVLLDHDCIVDELMDGAEDLEPEDVDEMIEDIARAIAAGFPEVG